MKAEVVAALVVAIGVADAFIAPSGFMGHQLTGATPCANGSSRCPSGVSMKLFDWKRRENRDGTDLEELRPETLKPAPGSRQKHKRKGRGISAGQGASCGFGMRGQKSRSGPGVRAGFEGGQTPLYRRLPKFVGRPMGPGHKKKEFNLIKLHALNTAPEGSTVNFESLFAAGAITKTKHRWHKIVGGEELTVSGLTVQMAQIVNGPEYSALENLKELKCVHQAHGFTKSAVEAIEAKGGKCQLLSPTTNAVVEMEDEDEDEGDEQEEEEAGADEEPEIEADEDPETEA